MWLALESWGSPAGLNLAFLILVSPGPLICCLAKLTYGFDRFRVSLSATDDDLNLKRDKLLLCVVVHGSQAASTTA